MYRQILIIFINIFILIHTAKAWSELDTVKVESNKYVVLHYHNWTESTKLARNKMMDEDRNPYKSENTYGRLLIISKGTSDTIKLPCSALSSIYINDEKNIVIGISNIYITNPYNIVIWTLRGQLLFKRWFEQFPGRLNNKELKYFKTHFPNSYNVLLKKDRIYNEAGNNYISYLIREIRGDSLAWKYLVKHSIRNQYFPSMSLGTDGSYYDTYLLDNPVHDVIMKGLLPSILILNREDGAKVKIPLLILW